MEAKNRGVRRVSHGSQEHLGGAGGGGVALRGRGLPLLHSLRQRATLVSHSLKPWADWVQPRPSAGAWQASVRALQPRAWSCLKTPGAGSGPTLP